MPEIIRPELPVCDECGGQSFHDPVRGETACIGCGLVLEETFIDSGPTFVQDSSMRFEGEVPNGYGPPIRIETGDSLAVPFSSGMYDAHGKRANQEERARRRWLSKLDHRVMSSKSRSFREMFAVVSDLCIKLSLSQELRDRAFYIMKKTYLSGGLRGLRFSVLAGAATLMAGKELRVPLNVKKDIIPMLAAGSCATEKQVNRTFRVLKRIVGSSPRLVAIDLLPAIASSLEVPPVIQAEARRIAEGLPVTGNPRADAAVALYVASRRAGSLIPQHVLAKTAGSTEVSMRARLTKHFPEFVQPRETCDVCGSAGTDRRHRAACLKSKVESTSEHLYRRTRIPIRGKNHVRDGNDG